MRFAAALLLLLGACDTADVAVQRAVEAGKKEKDLVADAVLPATCAISVGAWARLEYPSQQYGVALLCGFADMLKPPKTAPVDLPAPLADTTNPTEVE